MVVVIIIINSCYHSNLSQIFISIILHNLHSKSYRFIPHFTDLKKQKQTKTEAKKLVTQSNKRIKRKTF